MDEQVKSILASRKFQAALVALVVGIAAKLGLNWDPGTIGVLLSPFLAYIIGQGQADKGKAAADIQKQAAEITAAAATNVARIEASATVQAAKVAGPTVPAEPANSAP